MQLKAVDPEKRPPIRRQSLQNQLSDALDNKFLKTKPDDTYSDTDSDSIGYP